MKYLMYSICDKATTYMFPFPAYSDAAAIRNFATEINNNAVSRDNPGDFELFCVGEFDMETGMIDAFIPTKHIRSGMSVVRKDDYGKTSE